MKAKHFLSLTLSFVMLFSVMLPAYAEESEEGYVSTVGHKGASTYNDTFEENFENGLGMWHTETTNGTGVTDFEIIADPENSDNKVLHWTRKDIYLVPNDDVWPTEGTNAGQMKTVTMRMRFDSTTDLGGFTVGYVNQDNFSGVRFVTEFNKNKGIIMFSEGMKNGERRLAGGYPSLKTFDVSTWFTVSLSYNETNISIVCIDAKKRTYSTVISNWSGSGKFAISYNQPNSGGYNKELKKGTICLDDITVSFDKLSVDVDKPQTDVNVYYEGNTFYKPGETVQLTGEQLGNTVDVSNIKIRKLTDTLSTSENAKYLSEQKFDTSTATPATWDSVTGGDTEQKVQIVQQTDLGIKFILPDGKAQGDNSAYLTEGMYAVYLPSKSGGKPYVAVINNPEIDFSLQNDGEFATPNGWIKLAGHNFSVKNDSSAVRALIKGADGAVYTVDGSQIEVDTTENNSGRDNEYYMMIHLPNLPVGKYSVMVHNGYGGDIGYSEPHEFSVKAAPEYEKWESKGFFDVTAYGAKGDGYANDTGAIIAAMAAAEQNGGGTVYFPAKYNGKSVYRITDAIYVPANVSMIGDGEYQSAFLIDTYGAVSLPNAMFQFEHNFRVKDLYFYGSSMKNLFKKTENVKYNDQNYPMQSGYIYFENVQCTINSFSIFSEASITTLLEGTGNTEAYAWLASLSGGAQGTLIAPESGCTEKYVELNNVDFYRINNYYGGKAMSFNSEYLYLNKEKNYNYTMVWAEKAGFIENCYSSNGAVQPGTGNLMYRNCEMGDSVQNNNEILTTDGGTWRRNTMIQDINNYGLEGNNTVEFMLEKELAEIDDQTQKNNMISTVTDYINKYRGRAFRIRESMGSYDLNKSTIFVTDGQGAGQMRQIQKDSLVKIGDYTYLAVEDPFVVNPNRNSLVNIDRDRKDYFVTNCDFSNGGKVGTYGTLVNAVFDGNSFIHAQSGVTLCAHGGSVWYNTVKENTADDILYGHAGREVIIEPTGTEQQGSASYLGYYALAFRGNRVSDGGYFRFFATGIPKGNYEFVVENNTGVSSDGNIFRNLTSITGMDGYWFRNNKQYSEEEGTDSLENPYDTSFINMFKSSSNKANKYGFKPLICNEISDAVSASRQKGDINNDGYITLKDVTLLRYYIAEMSELDNETVNKYADVTGDGKVDLRDVIKLRYMVLGETGPEFEPDMPDDDDNGYSDNRSEYFAGRY